MRYLWFTLVACGMAISTALAQNRIINGDFAAGAAGWSTWVLRDANADLAITASDGELRIRGSNTEAAVYQQFATGGPGTVVSITGRWRSDPTLTNAMWGEVWILNADRVPVDGMPETDGVNGALLLYRNDTFGGRGAWNDAIPRSAPVQYRASFTAAAPRATLILKAGNTGPATPTGVAFADVGAFAVAPPATLGSLPAGFASRTYTFGVSNAVSIAQSPVSRNIYVVTNEPTATSTRLYRINTGGTFITASQVVGLGSLVDFAQGLAFDASGNLYISTQYGKIVKGTDTNADPAVDAFTFALVLDMPDLQIGTLHGVGGIAVGPDGKLYINSGSESHYGYLPDGSPEAFAGRLNARILRCNLDGTGIETFCEGIRNSFDITFRSDGKLFGVENGPNTACHYAEEFNLLEPGGHYGFPYKYGSDLSGSDSSYVCQNAGGGNVVGPPPLPPGVTPVPAWANYGPDGIPGPGHAGYADGGPYFGFQPHCSPDGISFYEPQTMDPAAIKFPPDYYGRAFVARFGNVEAVPPVGYDVLTLRLDETGAGFFCNTLLTGLGRAIDVLCAYNGAVYVLEYNQQSAAGGSWGSPSRLHEIRYTIPTQPRISLSTTAISRTAYLGEGLSNDTFTVANSGAGMLQFDVADDATWLDVAPASGTSSGTSDVRVVTVSYALDGLPRGTHTATIHVTDPAAYNSPQTIAVNVQLRGVRPDINNDGSVDLADFSLFQLCFNGPNAPPAQGNCGLADFDVDGDVDLSDFAVFQNCFNGPNRPPACQ